MIPKTDRQRIENFCAAQWPEQFHHEVFWEIHECGNRFTLCETRAPWDGKGEWTHQPLAQLQFRPEFHDWELHWPDRNSRWHLYDLGDRGPTGSCADLLAEIDEDPASIFKG